MVVFLLLSLLLDYYYYHYNILLRFLYFGEEEMATEPGVEAVKTASVFDVLRRFCSLLLEDDGLEPTFYSENFCPTRLPPILEAVRKKVDLCAMRYRCANFLIYYMISSFCILHYGSLRTIIEYLIS